MAVAGDGAGRHHGPGFVYVMDDIKGKLVKIGYLGNLTRRLSDIQRDFPDTILVGFTDANEMNRAETAAQYAVEQEHGLQKVKNNATDWYELRRGVTSKDVLKTVKRAVKEHNKTN